MRPFRLTLTLVAAIALVIAVAACGSSGSSSSSTAAGGSSSSTSSSSSGLSLAGLANTKPVPTQKMGGTLHVISNEGWEHLDPGASYFQIDYLVVYATQTPLYMFTPNSPTRPVPALASGPPQISSDGKTVTVHIKSGWKWSPPLNRDITSKDVAYAFQRDFNPNVQNGYAAGYYPIVGRRQVRRQADLRDQHAEQHDDRLPPDQELRRHVRRGADAARIGAGARVAGRAV